MSMINKLQDERIRKLAQTLRDSGLAASDSEAIRMAEGMAKTEAKITKKEPVVEEEKPVIRQEQPKQEFNSGFSVPNTTSIQENVAKEESVQEDIPGSIENLSQDIITSSYDKSGEDISNLTVEEAAGLAQPKREVVQEEPKEVIQQDIVEQQPSQERVAEEESHQEDEDLEEETRELSREESKPPKKDLSEFEESQVDLGSVFKFKG